MAASLDEIIKALKKATDSEKKAFKEALGADIGREGKPVAGIDYQKQADDLEAYIKKMDGLGKSTSAQVLKAQAIVEQKENLVKAAQREIELARELTPELIKNLEEQQKNLEVADETIKRFEDIAAKQQENIAYSKDFGSALQGAMAPFKKLNIVGTLLQIRGALGGGAEGAKEFMKALSIGLIDSIVGGLFDMAMQLDSLETNIQRATGASKEWVRDLEASNDALAAYYVTNEEFEKSVVGLMGTMTEFSGLSKYSRQTMVETTAILGKWGVSAETAGKSFQFANKIMGQTASQAATTSREMAAMAMNIGVPVDQMMQDFNTMMPELAKLGPTASESFKALAREAKKSGLEVQKILNLTNKFDTFEGAAEQTGKLNAALGGNFVNAMDMMTATDPIERFDMLRDSLDNAGLSFDDMSYYQRKFFAEQMGLDSVGDLALMMSGNMSNLGDEVGDTTSDYEDMAEMAAEQATLQEKWQGVLQQMMKDILDSGFLDYLHEMFYEYRKSGGKDGPVADFVGAMKTLAEVLYDIMNSGAFKWMIANLPLVIKLFVGIKFLQMGSVFLDMGKNILTFGGSVFSAAGKLNNLRKGLGDTADAAKGASDAVKGVTDTASELADKGKKAADAVGGATEPLKELNELGSEIAENPVTGALKDQADALEGVGGAAPTAAVGQQQMGQSTSFLGQVANVSAPQLMALGFAFLMIGAAVGIAAFGVSYLVDSFAKMDVGKIIAASFGLLAFAFGLKTIAVAMLDAIPMLTAGTPALWSLAGVMVAIGAAVFLAAFGMSLLMDSLVSVDAAKILATALSFVALGYAMAGMAAGLIVMGNPLAMLGLAVMTGVVMILTGAMEDLFASINTLSAAVLEPLALMFQMMGSMNTERIEKVSGEFKEIARVLKEDMDLGAVTEMTAMLIELKKAGDVLSSMSSKQNSKDREIKIELQLDPTATKNLLEGKVGEGTATLTLSAFGQR